MKKLKHIYSMLTLIVFAFMFMASGGVKLASVTQNQYEESEKKVDEPYTVSYNLPIITPNAETPQTQTKGGVTITCEIVPFEITMYDEVKREIFFADPKMPGYDVYEVSHTPVPKFNTGQFELNIKIKNNQDRILKVRETALLLQVDGITYHIPEASLTDWYAGMIIKNGEFNYKIPGPQFNSLANAKLIYLFINDVPTVMDEGGNIKKRENFEWYFECKNQAIVKEEKKTYTYETSPIQKEQCSKCRGTGTDPQAYKCSSCNGTGLHTNQYNGQTYSCSTCSGKGVVYYKCPNCKGKGEIAYPKSQLPRVSSSITWTLGEIEVITNPPGAKISIVDPKTKEYENVGMSNMTVDWYSSNEKSYPIVVEYQDQKVKILPYKDNGKLTKKVSVDFTGGVANVTKGQKVN